MAELLGRALRTALFFMSALLGAWALVPEGRTVAAGLLLGTAASVVNAFLLRRRVELIGRMAAEGDVVAASTEMVRVEASAGAGAEMPV